MNTSASVLDLPALDVGQLSDLLSPSLIWFYDRIEANVRQMVQMVGEPDRLRPHCKTHKSADIIRMLLDHGVTSHKAATIAEVEMLLSAGVTDVVLAYPPIGPTVKRLHELAVHFPQANMKVVADCGESLQHLSEVFSATDDSVGVLLDINVGQNRTGIAVDSEKAVQRYRQIDQLPALRPAGLQIYDGHIRASSPEERSAIVDVNWNKVLKLKSSIEAEGLELPELLCGGTPTFPMYASRSEPSIKCSPGTCVLHDAGYGRTFADLPFQPAAAVVTRVVSRPADGLLTLDAGNKSIAADPPMDRRAYLPQLPDAVIIGHNEEHMVVQTSAAHEIAVGTVLLAIPGHVCPTSALHAEAAVVRNGQLSESWPITARNRSIGV